ncbi:MAG: metallophosphoesterase family protein [Patescibacteria group bacterium]|jgi:predicted phosphodiesterase
MKTLIFSDTHLTNKPDPKRMAFLKKIINEADRVIINGDFWDGVFISFDQFLSSPWQELFPLLKKKNTIYVYGNHDKKERCDERVSLFSNHQAESYSLSLGNKTLLITHGHNLNLSFTKTVKILKICRPLFRLDHFLANILGRKYLYWSRKKYNQEVEKEAKKLSQRNQILVCGHTHLAQKDPKKGFINLGCLNFGLGQYLIVEDNSLKFYDLDY